MKTIRAIVLSKKDNVATAISDVSRGSSVEIIGEVGGRAIIAKQPIPFGHKISLTDLNKGDYVIKYGEIIGKTTSRIKTGEHIHVHNVESLRARGDIKQQMDC